jgi:hypothetical protein
MGQRFPQKSQEFNVVDFLNLADKRANAQLLTFEK